MGSVKIIFIFVLLIATSNVLASKRMGKLIGNFFVDFRLFQMFYYLDFSEIASNMKELMQVKPTERNAFIKYVMGLSQTRHALWLYVLYKDSSPDNASLSSPGVHRNSVVAIINTFVVILK